MKKIELTFAFVQLPLDYALIVLAGITAYALRFTSLPKASARFYLIFLGKNTGNLFCLRRWAG